MINFNYQFHKMVGRHIIKTFISLLDDLEIICSLRPITELLLATKPLIKYANKTSDAIVGRNLIKANLIKMQKYKSISPQSWQIFYRAASYIRAILKG